MLTYYRQLGLLPEATDAQVQRAVRRYWQRVARFRPAHEQQAFLKAAAVLGNPTLRAAYDPAYRPAASVREGMALRTLNSTLRTRLHAEQTRSFRLEHEIRRLRSELSHALSYPEEMAAGRQERRQRWGWLAVGLLLTVLVSLIRNLGNNNHALTGPPYEPVGVEYEGFPFFRADSTGVYEQAENMPQYPGGATGLRDLLRQRVYRGASMAGAERLCATGQVRFVVDSTGLVRGSAQVLGLPATDSLGGQLLQRAVVGLPRLIPGYVQARPVPVRLTVPLAE